MPSGRASREPAAEAPTPLPAPTREIERAKRDLDATGLCLIEGVLDGATLERVREALYRAARDDRERGRARSGFALDPDARNQRVWNLLSRDPVFADLAEHPVALELVRHVLGWPALLSNISGNIAGPGGAAGVLHADQIFVPEPWPAAPQGVNVLWCADAFTAENGATLVIPGSHRWNRPPRPEDEGVEMVPLEAAAGTVVGLDSRVWHRTGANTTRDAYRAGIFPFYSTTIYRPQENWFLSLDPRVRRDASETLLTLLGYRSAGFGLVYGESPE